MQGEKMGYSGAAGLAGYELTVGSHVSTENLLHGHEMSFFSVVLGPTVP